MKKKLFVSVLIHQRESKATEAFEREFGKGEKK